MSLTNWRRTVIVFAAILLVASFGFQGIAGAKDGLDAADESLLIVNKKKNQLAYFKSGKLVRVFPIATGKSKSLTPEGTFPIVNKIKNRPYYTDNIPGGDTENPLGDRWMGLSVGNTYGTTYAIHGNNNPDSIGKYVSKGCIRMHNDDIHWLFERVELLTKVVITSSELSFEELAVKHQYDLFMPMDIPFVVDGKPHDPPKGILLYRETAYVPLRPAVEALNGIVHYEPETKAIIVTIGERHLIHHTGTETWTLNGEPVQLDFSTYLWDGTTLVPLRAFASLFECNVHWESSTKTIYIERAAE